MSELPSLDALDVSEYDSLEAAIAENPDAVAAFVRRLDAVNELLDVVALGTSALEDDMVAELARTGARLGEVADEAADPGAVRGLTRLIRAVNDAETTGSEPVGPVGLVKSVRAPEVRAGLGYLLALVRALGRRD